MFGCVAQHNVLSLGSNLLVLEITTVINTNGKRGLCKNNMIYHSYRHETRFLSRRDRRFHATVVGLVSCQFQNEYATRLGDLWVPFNRGLLARCGLSSTDDLTRF